MKITKKIIAGKINSYLHHEITQKALVDWAEKAIMKDDFDELEIKIIRESLGRIGFADVRSFGLTWEDCEELLHNLGYTAKIQVLAA